MTEAVTAIGFAKCEKPERYIKQLVSHWSHKMATSYDEGDGMGAFPFSERNEHMRGVIERHLDRFAFREAPLSYEWEEQ